jgi:hypothetical protein
MTRLKQFLTLDFSGQEKVTVIKIKRRGTEGVDQHGRIGEDITVSYRQRPTKGREAINWKGREIRPAPRKEVSVDVPAPHVILKRKKAKNAERKCSERPKRLERIHNRNCRKNHRDKTKGLTVKRPV